MPVLTFLVFLAVVLTTGFLGSLATREAIPTWYRTLNKPRLNPPNWIFAPVWTVLYILIAVSAWLCWQVSGAGAWLVPFGLQLVLNLAWSFIFFKYKKLSLALVEILALWTAIVWTLIAHWQIAPLAGALLIPYLLWVSFATFLNAAIWKLNPAHR